MKFFWWRKHEKDPEERKEGNIRRWVFLGVVVVILSGLGNLVEGYDIIHTNNIHHSSDVSYQNQVIDLLGKVQTAQHNSTETLNEIQNLANQVNSVISGLPAADAYLAAFAQAVITDIQSLCSISGAICPPINLSNLPGSSSTTTAPSG